MANSPEVIDGLSATTIAGNGDGFRADLQTAEDCRRFGQFTRIGHIPGGGQPLLREGGPISYDPRPLRCSGPNSPPLQIAGDGNGFRADLQTAKHCRRPPSLPGRPPLQRLLD